MYKRQLLKLAPGFLKFVFFPRKYAPAVNASAPKGPAIIFPKEAAIKYFQMFIGLKID